MSLEVVNRICPNCMNPNYMVLLGGYSKTYKYKCINCNGYFNDIDFEKEPLQPVWLTECMNKKVDMVEVVRCKDCIHYHYYGLAEETVSECEIGHCENQGKDWYCADGERRDTERKK